MMAHEQSDQPLSDQEAADVLRYWLASMRYQEALAARPKAVRPRAGSAEPGAEVPNLAAPAPGRKYMKLDWTGREAFVSARRGQLELPIDVEARGLFEDWLFSSYRRGGDDEEATRVGYLLTFPALLLPRGELAGLLRGPLELDWLAPGAHEFVVPTSAERATSKYPEPPSALRISHALRESDDALPFFVDVKLLADVLRVDAERIDALFAELGKKARIPPRRLITALTALLEAQMRDDGQGAHSPRASSKVQTSKSVLGDLHAALTARLAQLGSRTRAFPTALIQSSDGSRVTAHAQRDIEATLELLADRALSRDAPLSRYLRGQVAEHDRPRSERCLGRFSATGLTPHQADALELSLARRFCAIQGPPGTGKTTLILNRIADALVRKVLPLGSGHAMGDGVLIVTSTNNAAVDNVTAPLGPALGPDRLPLALRVGSREVVERVTSADLEHCLAWLGRRAEPAAGELEDALKDFLARHAARVKGVTGPDQAPSAASEREGYELFRCAERVRELWAAKNRGNLLNVLELGLRAARSSRSLSSLLAKQNKAGAWLRRLFPAFGSTLLSLGNVFPSEADCIEHAIIDEAGQCHPGFAVSALLRVRSAAIIGDVHQLEPVIGLSREDERRVVRGLGLTIAPERLEPYRTHDESGISAQHLADRATPLRPTLVDHFRCQADIAAICERLCGYGLVVRSAPSTRRVAGLARAVSLVPSLGEQERSAGSWANAAEAREVIAWVLHLLGSGISSDEIGVITPFRGQLDLLTRELGRAGVPLADPLRAEPLEPSLFSTATRGLSLGTVHRFQGGERNIILLSTTVTKPSSLRFVDERVNLINVAASRAKEHLITIGHEATLLAGRHTRALLLDAERLTPLVGT
jgi:hypothetical protein